MMGTKPLGGVWIVPCLLMMAALCPIAPAKVIFVDDDATGANDGSNWANAYVHLQDALADADSAEKPVEIRVARGIHRPDEGANQTPGNRGASFRLINDVAIKGSYAGLGHEDPDARDVAGFTTSDLAGDWFLGGSDIQGNHTWDGLLTISSAGALTGGTLSSSDGAVYTFVSGDLVIGTKGKVTGHVTDSEGITIRLTMQMNRSKGIVAGEGNAQIDNEDGVFIFIKKSSGFLTSDLAGEWFLGGSDIQGSHTWDGLLLIDSTGAISGGTLASSEGPVYTFVGGSLAIDATGKVTGQITDSDGVTTQLTMQMDNSKGIVAGEGNAQIDEEDGVFIFVRKSLGFMTDDLAGEWFLGGSDIQGSHTWDGFLLIDSRGAIAGGMLASSEGPVYTFVGGSLAIDATGKVTGQVTDSDGVTTRLTMQMDQSKGIIAGEGNAQIEGEDGVFLFVRRSSRYQTILSGDLLGNDAVVDDPCDLLNEPSRADNSYHVVYGYELDPTAILDGFTVSDGNTAGYAGYAGGMYLRSGSEPTVSNCTFRANSARYGGAICNRSSSKPVIVNCLFRGNAAGISGSALYNEDSCGVTLANCVFIGNDANPGRSAWGGTVFSDQDCELTLTDCTFLRNRAARGGAIVDMNVNETTYLRCSFIQNTAGRGGGVYAHMYSEMSFKDCSFIGNQAHDVGGGFDAEQGPISAVFTNCIFRANSASSGGGVCSFGGSASFQNCVFTENCAGTHRAAESFANTHRGGGAYIYNTRASLTECVFFRNEANETGGGLHTTSGSFMGSPVLTRCIIVGNRAPEGGGVYNYCSSPVLALVHCTVSGNRANYGAGIYSARRSQLQNCIVWGNEASVEAEVYGSNAISYSDIAGGWAGDGNIDAAPLFVDPGYWDTDETPEDVNDDVWVNGDYHLRSEAGRWDAKTDAWVIDDVTSPCIDAGDPNSPMAFEPFPNGGLVNMGAYGATAEASKSPSGLHAE
ncbi:MAG: hypothetical protein JW741_20125 [Sedimentisphaerales bacterium]|nr:hypothetical protein [Sedimentisphaerales bacterium]